MYKVISFFIIMAGFVCAILIPTYQFFKEITSRIDSLGLFKESINFLWQGFGIIIFIVIALSFCLALEVFSK